MRKILILIVINVLSYLPYVWVVEKGRFASQKYTFRHKFLKGLAKRASTKEYTVRSFGFHSLRRYVATYLSDKEKVATKTIQKILGHSSEATTERYLYNAHRDLEAVMELLGSDKASTEEGNEHTSQGGGALVH
ncbi:MAG: tyrosine-type recombinase/integrase [Syntrophobacteraceae bacterium]